MPPRNTRKDATAGAGRWRSAILPAMKFSAQRVTTTSTATAIVPGFGPLEWSDVTTGVSFTMYSSDELFGARRELFDEVHLQVVADTRRCRNRDRAARRNFDFGLDDVFDPVALAGGDVAGKREVGQRRKRDVVRAADAGFEHAAAPDRDAAFLAEIVNAANHGVPANAAELDVDDFAGAERDRRT